MEETVVVEAVEAEAQVVASEEDTALDLVDFNYLEYTQFMPEDTVEKLTEVLSNKTYGWKTRARILVRIKDYTQTISELQEELSELTLGKRTRTVKIDPRKGLVAFLNSQNEEYLQRACSKYNVNFASFADNREMLLEALADEIEKGE